MSTSGTPFSHTSAALEKRALTSRQRLLAAGAWLASLVLGCYLRWSRLEITEFGGDQFAALYMAQRIRDGLELPLAGAGSSVGAPFGPGEYYLMVIPLLFSDAPEVASLFVSTLGLVAGVVFSILVWRYFGAFAGVATMALYATAPWAVYFTRKIWTPDTLPFFAAVVVALLVEALANRRRWTLPAALLVLGMAIQVHLSAVVLVPVVALAFLLFWRRVRLLELLVGGVLLALPQLPYLNYILRGRSESAGFLAGAASQPVTVELRSLDYFQTLVSGIGFPDAVGVQLLSEQLGSSLPWAGILLAFAFWGGVAVSVWEVARAVRRRNVGRRATFLVIALLWCLVPPLLLIAHPITIFLRYFLFILPVCYLFPALFLATVAKLGRRALAEPASSAEAGLRRYLPAGASVALLALTVAGNALLVENVQAALAAGRVSLVDGKKDFFSPPLVRDSRELANRLRAIASPDRELVLFGYEAGSPLEYIDDWQMAVRFMDKADQLLVPDKPVRMVFLPHTFAAADLAQRLGARERTDLSLSIPPGNEQTRIFDVDPGDLSRTQDFVHLTDEQILPNGLQLLSYAVENVGEREFDLLTVWQLVAPDWAYRFPLYNSFVHLYDLSGRQLDVYGEVELSGSPTWKDRELLVIKSHVVAGEPIPRGLYRVDMGVYVRYPARHPLEVESWAVPAAVMGPVRLGVASEGGVASPRARFGDAIELATASAAVDPTGAVVEVDLAWRTATPVERDYTVFAHLYDGAGNLVAQADGWPADGNYPTSAWLPGELVPDRRAIALPSPLPEGAYTVKVGLYDPMTGERLPPTPDDGDRSVAVATLQLHRP